MSSIEPSAAPPAGEATSAAASSTEPVPDPVVDAAKKASLLRQLEYYFADVSFPYDDFLRSQCNEAGSVPATVLAGSPRIVAMTSDLTPEQRVAVLLEVVAESDDVKAVDGDRLARVWPLPADDPKAEHSVYLSGVPKNADEAALRTMLESCRPSFGRVVAIRRLRDVQRDRAYSGQIFIECEDAEKAATLVRAASKGASGVSCNKARLLRDFFDKQDATIREQKEKRAAKLAAGGGASSAASGTKRPHDEVAAEPEPETAEQTAAREAKEATEKALLVRFENAGPSTDREALEEICGIYGKVAFVNFQRGDSCGTIRFESADVAAAALSGLLESTPDVGGAVASWREMTCEESLTYWQTYRDRKAAQHAQKRHRGGGKGKGKGGRGGHRGGGRAHGRS